MRHLFAAVAASSLICGAAAAAPPAPVVAGAPAAPAPEAAKGKFDADTTGPNIGRMTLGYTYYNRPGADLKTHNDEVNACAVAASKTRAMDEIVNAGASGGILGAIIGGAMANAYHHGVVGAALENCMVVRGWRVVHLPDAEGAALAALPQDQVAAHLAPWIGAEVPHGDVVRVWNNDATHVSVNRFSQRPNHTNDGLLSLKAAAGQTLKDFHDQGEEPPVRVKLDKRWPKKPLAPTALAAVPADAAFIIGHVKGGGLRGAVTFVRMGPNPNMSAAAQDFGPDRITSLSRGSNGAWFIMAVPAGRWRIAELGFLYPLSLCLGSPSFEVKPGDVAYVGTFDFNAEEMGPDLSLEAPRAYMGATPQAAKLKPVAYVNGSTARCGGSELYALEVKGAAFEPGYEWGGARAKAAGGKPATEPVTPAAPAGG